MAGTRWLVTRAEAGEGTELIVSSTEPPRGADFLEAAYTLDPAFHAPIVALPGNDKISKYRIEAGPSRPGEAIVRMVLMATMVNIEIKKPVA